MVKGQTTVFQAAALLAAAVIATVAVGCQQPKELTVEEECSHLINGYLREELEAIQRLEASMSRCVLQVVERSRGEKDEVRSQLIAVLVADKRLESWDYLLASSQESTKNSPQTVFAALSAIGGLEHPDAEKILLENCVPGDQWRSSAALSRLTQRYPESASKFLDQKLKEWEDNPDSRKGWRLDRVLADVRRADSALIKKHESRLQALVGPPSETE